MSTSSINSSTVNPSDRYSSRKAAASNFQSLVQSLQQNDLAGAQQAYSSLQQILPANSSTNASSRSPTSGSALSSIASDWSSLGQALQSGNLNTAQSTLSTLQQDAVKASQSYVQAYQDASSVYNALQAGNSTGTSAVSGTNGNTLQSDISSLNQALQSGDISGAQKLLAQLESAMQSSGLGHSSGHHHHHHGGAGMQQAQNGTNSASTSAATTSASTSTSATAAA